MIVLPKDEVTFTAEDHKYVDKYGRELISVSTLIHKFVPEFDPDGSILRRCAEKKGVTPEELKAEWERINKESCVYGSAVHAELEYYIDNKKIKRKSEYKDVVKQFSEIKFQGELQSETKIWSLEHRIAGTVDLIEFLDDDIVSIYDFKTNKKLEKYSIFGNKMLPPFQYLYSTNFMSYTLQLNLYAYLIEELGYWVKDLTIFYINPKNMKIETHPVPFRRGDTIKLIRQAKNFVD